MPNTDLFSKNGSGCSFKNETFRRNGIWIGYPECDERTDIHQVFIDPFLCARFYTRFRNKWCATETAHDPNEPVFLRGKVISLTNCKTVATNEERGAFGDKTVYDRGIRHEKPSGGNI